MLFILTLALPSEGKGISDVLNISLYTHPLPVPVSLSPLHSPLAGARIPVLDEVKGLDDAKAAEQLTALLLRQVVGQPANKDALSLHEETEENIWTDALLHGYPLHRVILQTTESFLLRFAYRT